jgi:photosystem II stability/assembly factor-like uncharacterized protein
MKRAFFYLVGLQILFCASAEAQTWQYTNGPFTDSADTTKVNDVVAFSKLNDTCLFAASAAHGLFRTFDAGNHWKNVWFVQGDTVNCVASKNSIVLIGTNKGLVRSTDSGQTFDSAQLIFYRPWISEIVCDRNGNFYAIASQGRIGSNTICLLSPDDGVTWEPLTTPTGLMPEMLVVDSSNQLLFVGGYYNNNGTATEIQIWKSIDSGSSWSKTESPYYLEDGLFYGASPNGDLYVSTIFEGLILSNDSAYDLWDPIGYPGARNDIPHNFAFLNSSTVCVAADSYLYLTNDRGMTWESIEGAGHEFPACQFSFGGDLFAASDSGVVRLSTTNLSVNEPNSDQSTELAFIYPGKLSLMLETAGPATLDLFDVTGRSVASFDYAELPSGQTIVPLPASLPSGMYLARCEDRTGIQTSKFIVEP